MFNIFGLTSFAFAFVLIGIASGSNYLKEKPDFFKPCSLTDGTLNECYKDNLQALLSNFKDGIPGLPAAGSLDPVKIKALTIRENNLELVLKRISIAGLSKTKFTKVVMNPTDLTLFVAAEVPLLQISGNYSMTGRILFLPLNGKGRMFVEAERAEFTFKVKVKLRFEDGLTFAELSSVETTIKNIGAFRARMDNLFNGNKALEESANTIFNQHWRDFIEVLRPTMQDSINMVTVERFQRFFNYIPLDYLIAEPNTQ